MFAETSFAFGDLLVEVMNKDSDYQQDGLFKNEPQTESSQYQFRCEQMNEAELPRHEGTHDMHGSTNLLVSDDQNFTSFSNGSRSFSTSDLPAIAYCNPTSAARDTELQTFIHDVRIPEYKLSSVYENEEGVFGKRNSDLSARDLAMARETHNMNPRKVYEGMNQSISDFPYSKDEVYPHEPLLTNSSTTETQAKSSKISLKRTQSDAIATSEQNAENAGTGGRTGRRFIRRRSSERRPFENVPTFIQEELNGTTGIGHFTMSELMCCLLFAHRESLSSNSYANIRAKMGNKRSRVSIRRKIEKIVMSETGLSGGLLGLTGDQHQLVLDAIWNRLMNLISEAEIYGTPRMKEFASKLREYAENPPMRLF